MTVDAAAGPKRVEHPSRLAVRLRDLVVVARRHRPAVTRVAVRRVRLEQVHPQEEVFAAMPIQPGDRLVHRDPAGTLVGETAVRAAGHAIAVDLEAGPEPEPMIEWEGRDERA